MDTYTKEVDGLEITLADGYYPLEIAKFDESGGGNGKNSG